MFPNVQRIDQRDDAVQLEGMVDLVLDQKRLRDRTRRRKPRAFDQYGIELVMPFDQPVQGGDEVALDRTADTSVAHFKDIFVGTDHQIVIYRNFAELVFDHGDAFAVVAFEDII